MFYYTVYAYMVNISIVVDAITQMKKKCTYIFLFIFVPILLGTTFRLSVNRQHCK